MQISWAGLFGVLPFFFFQTKRPPLEKNKKNLKGCGDLSL